MKRKTYERTPEQNKKHSLACKGKSGKFKRTLKQNQRMSSALRGRKFSKEHSKKLSKAMEERWKKGEFKKIFARPEVKEKKKIVARENSFKIDRAKNRERLIVYNKQNPKRGSQNGNWRGGISSENQILRGSKENRLWKRSVLLRDNFICQECEINKVYVVAHHIKSWKKYPELRFAIDNGVTLCRGCHKKIHPLVQKN
ncbi:MAG: HNH endonuclease signature motif containing protein [Candidatus Gastranaerophilaceae bacterium]|jgi:hypothetical protein